MNRRQFCRIGALALGALGVGTVDTFAMSSRFIDELPVIPRACYVKVLRRECFDELQALYLDDPDEGPCVSFTEGDSWMFNQGDSCPRGFCPRVWHELVSILKDAETGACCRINDGAKIMACPDGTRPVIFYIKPM